MVSPCHAPAKAGVEGTAGASAPIIRQTGARNGPETGPKRAVFVDLVWLQVLLFGFRAQS